MKSAFEWNETIQRLQEEDRKATQKVFDRAAEEELMMAMYERSTLQVEDI